MSLEKKLDHVVGGPSKRAGSGVIVHCIHPSVGRFKHQRRSPLELRWSGSCALKAAYADSIAPVCGYGVFNSDTKEGGSGLTLQLLHSFVRGNHGFQALQKAK